LAQEFVRVGRARQRRAQAFLISVVAVILIIAIVASVVFQNQAQANIEIANTAQAAQATSQANAEEAQKQTNIALARQLAAQAQSINANRSSKQMIAILLATQSMNMVPSSEAAQVLLNNNFATRTITRMAHNGPVYCVAFSPDGKYVVSGSADKTTRIWLWQPNDLIANACKYLPRNLTHAEWNQYIGDALPYQAVCPNLPVEAEVIPTPSPTSTP
jgi:type II secretory pathway pseudopilin PulG